MYHTSLTKGKTLTMADSQSEAASGPVTDATATTDPSTTEQSTPAELPDLTSAKESITEAATRAGLEAEVANLKRAAGHVPGLQKQVAALEKQLKGAPTGVAADRWNALIDTLESEAGLSPAALRALRLNAQSETSDPRVEALEAEIAAMKTAPEGDEVSPQVAALQRGWERSEAIARQHGVTRGLSAEEMPPLAEWTAIFNEDPTNPAAGLDKVMAKIEERVAAKARRSEKADAASGGAAGTQTTRQGGLTRERMKTMTTAQLREYTQEERNAALSAP